MTRIIVLCIVLWSTAVQADKTTVQLQPFPLPAVKLTDGPFLHAQQTNIDYLLRMEVDRLLAPYLREAGLPIKSESYENWENTGLDGHIGGHYLTALSLAFAASGDERLKQRLSYMLTELRKAQLANGDGYLAGIPAGQSVWREVASGNIEADLFSMNKLWVPWYNLHKIYAGLRDAYQIGGYQVALTMLIELADWADRLVANLTEAQIQQMLITEHGGMNEVFADLAAITGNKKYLKLAELFSQKSILNPLLQKQDKLNGLHANTQIPKVIGFKRVAEVAGNNNWTDAAEYFWRTVTQKRTVVIGGNSVREHFHAADDFSSMLDDVEGPETCNTYNMLKLSKMLFLNHPSAEYIDYYERALYNHILASQHPEHGGLVYFTPMRPSHYRVYSKHDEAMWCCVGSGIENHSKYGELIYAQAESQLFVNLFIASELDYQQAGLKLEQTTLFPDIAETTFKFKAAGKRSADFIFNLRIPSWLNRDVLIVTINGKIVKALNIDNGYLAIQRTWQAGDQVTLSLPSKLELEQIPDKQNYYAVLKGPIVLAAQVNPFPQEKLNFVGDDSRMGHIANAPICPPEATPVMVGEPESFIAQLQPVAGQSLTYRANTAVYNPNNENLTLIPFFRLHDSRYQIYWPQATKDDLQSFLQKGEQVAAEKAKLEAITIDKVAPGEQQPEADHFFAGERTEAGVHMRRHWRHSQAWFSYQMKDQNKKANYLRVTYFGLDAGRHFSIWIAGQKIADVDLTGQQGNEFFHVDYEIPQSVKDLYQDTFELKFVADEGSVAGGIYGVRIIE
ncbi:glycoside hydrolase family 127 protein [Catenovulum sediminis]|uniref:Glycoside hydrolase family 127 protein n=1 Tax=Catenovulum sediminis TaxID=1740262 RepID=A0ABV1RC26_9ALTE|nr:glycoside hydrolase family 127 protein [Catenovulum sediminis]